MTYQMCIVWTAQTAALALSLVVAQAAVHAPN
jgi:hypothetical protein